jgi:hypothetical protein
MRPLVEIEGGSLAPLAVEGMFDIIQKMFHRSRFGIYRIACLNG